MSHYDVVSLVLRNPDWAWIFLAGCVWGVFSFLVMSWLMISCVAELWDRVQWLEQHSNR